MTVRSRLSALAALRRHRDLSKLASMMFLFFLVVLAVGVLRPVKNAFALDGLADTEFYKVYLVSAVVVLFVPLYNRLADRIRWKVLIPSVAMFFVANLILFRVLYREGSTWFGIGFYGWYDLFAAALVTQFFIATQFFFNARDAKRAYPMVIVGGSIGATLGGAITGFFAEKVGTANLLLVAAGAIALFAVLLAVVWASEDPDEGRARDSADDPTLSAGEFRRIFSNPQVRLIAATVFLTIIVKQLVDYQYNTLTEAAFGDVDAVSAFQGKFYASTQWLPILVLVGLRPLLQRYGLAVAVLLFPVMMFATTTALALFWGLWAAVAAKGADTTLRYSAERTAREILYVPVPADIKLKAKAYIDVAIEKGIGKASSAVLIFVLLSFMSFRHIAYVGAGLALVLLISAIAVRREYVRSLARSIEGRFASLEGTYVGIPGQEALGMVRSALEAPDPVTVAFGLELVGQADAEDLAELSPPLHQLLDRPEADIREAALQELARVPDAADLDVVRRRLRDDEPEVRKAAVGVLVAATDGGRTELFEGLLAQDDPRVRSAALAALAHDVVPERAREVVRPFYEKRRAEAGRPADDDHTGLIELAGAAGLMSDDAGAAALLLDLMQHQSGDVSRAAMLGAGRLAGPDLVTPLIVMLGSARHRTAARNALQAIGEPAIEPLISTLNDPTAGSAVRRSIPAVLDYWPTPRVVNALIESYLNPETSQYLDDRTLRALNRLRSRHPDLDFPADRVRVAIDREVATTQRYLSALATLRTVESGGPAVHLLHRALTEARQARREGLFRWLGLVFDPNRIYRAYLALGADDQRIRSNGLEWLEEVLPRELFGQIRPALRRAPEVHATSHVTPVLCGLWQDEDVWIARCALWAFHELDTDRDGALLREYRAVDPGLARSCARLLGRYGEALREDIEPMDLIEKVFLLQNVDLLRGTRSQQLALLGTIARELEADSDRKLLSTGEPTDALYVVIRGEVELSGVGGQSLRLTDGQAFGTWALIDEEPSMLEARTVKPTSLLRIRRRDFHDLLDEHPELGLDLLKGLARRVRTLVEA